MLAPSQPVHAPAPGPQVVTASQPFFHGTWALAVAIGLTFVTAFLLMLMLLAASARNRRRKDLAKRMDVARAQGSDQVVGDSGYSGWIREPLVQAAEQVAGNRGFLEGLDRRFEKAGVRLRGGEFLVIS